MLEVNAYLTEEPGPRLLVLGAVHGNETCGATALHRLRDGLQAGRLMLRRGTLTFVPVCNPRAYAEGKRFMERNLNRFLVPTENPTTYEAQLGNALCPLMAACTHLLDIHSYPNGGPPFGFVGGHDSEEDALAQSLGVDTILSGWEEAYAATGRQDPTRDPLEGVGTEEWARRNGAHAALIECGDHLDPQAPEVAYRAVRGALDHLGMLPWPERPSGWCSSSPRRVRVDRVVYRDREGMFVKPWRHLDPVATGEVVARTVDGTELCASQGGFILLPDANAALGQEWFYLGREEGT